MNIRQVVPSLEARQGGPSRSVRGLAESLAQIGHTVELLTTGPLDGDTARSVGTLTTRTFPRRWPDQLAWSAPLHGHMRAYPADMVHHHGLWQRTLHYARDAAASTHAPLVISPRGMMCPWAWNHRRWKKRLASWFIHPGAFSAAAGWHATSTAEADDIRNLGFTQPVCVAPNGVVAPSAEEEVAAAQRWHHLVPKLAGRRVALFYSRFHSKKRVLELIDLWLSKPRGDWVLLVAGIPEQYSVNQLDSYLVRNSGSDSIIVHDGAGQPSPYAVASLFLLPSHSENFGLVVAEALVRGVPVLTTDTTPWAELAAHGAGACVAWSDYGSTLSSLLEKTPEALHESGARASEWARATFSWEKAAATLAGFYRELIAMRQ